MEQTQFFEGWYFKHQWEGHTLAVIPARHRSGGRETASLQIITESAAQWQEVPAEMFRVEREPLRIRAGESMFSLEGCRLECVFQGRPLRGELRYGPAACLRGDIMGPFRFVPWMQCRHSVVSMGHTVEGTLRWGEEELAVTRGSGYVEGDLGRSFPRRYVWTHCAFPGGSLMLSAADVPLAGGFTGAVGFVRLHGRTLRLATYLGLRLLGAGPEGMQIRQGRWQLAVELLEGRPLALRAPVDGAMNRTIRESAACTVRYYLTRDGACVLDLTSTQAGFEADWPE